MNKRQNQAQEFINSHEAEKNLTLTLFGPGEVAEQFLIQGAKIFQYNNAKINNINLIGRQTPKTNYNISKLEEEIRGISVSNNLKINHYQKSDLGLLLPKTDLFIFSADGNSNTKQAGNQETNRLKLTKANVEILKEIKQYFNKDFKGLINIMSNIPEVLAHFVAKEYDLNSIEQIVAHGPVDSIRFTKYIQDTFKDELSNKGYFPLTEQKVIGHHCEPWPITKGIFLQRELKDEITGRYKLEWESMDRMISKHKNFQQKAADYLKNYADIYAEKEKQLLKQVPENERNKIVQRGLTVVETGNAIAQHVKTYLEDGETIAGIPLEISNKGTQEIRFVNHPVKYKNQEITQKNIQLTESDKEEISRRMFGKSQGDINSLDTLIEKSIGTEYINLGIDKSKEKKVKNISYKKHKKTNYKKEIKIPKQIYNNTEKHKSEIAFDFSENIRKVTEDLMNLEKISKKEIPDHRIICDFLEKADNIKEFYRENEKIYSNSNAQIQYNFIETKMEEIKDSIIKKIYDELETNTIAPNDLFPLSRICRTLEEEILEKYLIKKMNYVDYFKNQDKKLNWR